jgi:hypothetical protein
MEREDTEGQIATAKVKITRMEEKEKKRKMMEIPSIVTLSLLMNCLQVLRSNKYLHLSMPLIISNCPSDTKIFSDY